MFFCQPFEPKNTNACKTIRIIENIKKMFRLKKIDNIFVKQISNDNDTCTVDTCESDIPPTLQLSVSSAPSGKPLSKPCTSSAPSVPIASPHAFLSVISVPSVSPSLTPSPVSVLDSTIDFFESLVIKVPVEEEEDESSFETEFPAELEEAIQFFENFEINAYFED